MLDELTRYIALGDSMSMDLYPALDAGEIDVAVALERRTDSGAVAPLGAASLLYRNDDARYPDQVGQDLVSLSADVTMMNLAEDGASIGDVFGGQLMQLEPAEGSTLITLTAGGHDLFSAFANRPRGSLLDAITREVMEAYELLVDAIRRAVPGSHIVLTSITDPSDGTGAIPGALEHAGKLPVGVLDAMNRHIHSLASGTPNVSFADAHGWFLGHGVTAEEDERWYWRRSLVEPNARGADALRRLWWQVVEGTA